MFDLGAKAKIGGLGLVACLLLSGCEEASRETLTGAPLEAFLSDSKISLQPQFSPTLPPVMVTFNADKTGRSEDGDFNETFTWRVEGQTLCVVNDKTGPTKRDCVVIGWVEGNRMGVYEKRFGEMQLSAIGTVSRL